MPHADDVNDQGLVGDDAGGEAVADADSVAVIGAGEFGAADRPRGAGQGVNRLGDAAAAAAVRPPARSRRFDLILPALSLGRKRVWAVTHENRGNRGGIPNGAMAQ